MASKVFLYFDAVMRISLVGLIGVVFIDLLNFLFYGAFYDAALTRIYML